MDDGNSQVPPEKGEKKNFITIPSYREALHGASSSSSPSVSAQPAAASSSAAAGKTGAVGNPTSFSEAFSFIKNTEFYTPPPEPAIRASETPSEPSTAAAPAGAASLSGQNRNAILVSHRQKGNPLLKHIRNVRWVFADVVCDYLLGQSSCALYLSLRYHLLHPDYLYHRIRELQKSFKLRVVLCHVDVEDVIKPLLEVTRTALLHDCTLLCGWSLEECGRYLETIKVYENKSADNIREQMETDYTSRLTHALTTVRRVNKTDVVTLGSTFGSLSCIMDASMEELARCPGIGERKVRRLYDTFHQPFKRVCPVPVMEKESSYGRGVSEPELASNNITEQSEAHVESGNDIKICPGSCTC